MAVVVEQLAEGRGNGERIAELWNGVEFGQCKTNWRLKGRGVLQTLSWDEIIVW